MPQRVSDSDVKEILPTTINTQPFIAAATLQVDYYAPRAGWSPALAREIERWWSAHLACVRDPRLVDVRDGDTAVRYERGSTSGEGLASTSYGKQVLAMDPSGTLERVTMKRAWVRFQ